MSEDEIACLIVGLISIFLMVYAIILFVCLLIAWQGKSRSGYDRLAALLPRKHNTLKRRRQMTERQIVVMTVFIMIVVLFVSVSFFRQAVVYLS